MSFWDYKCPPVHFNSSLFNVPTYFPCASDFDQDLKIWSTIIFSCQRKKSLKQATLGKIMSAHVYMDL